MTILLLIVLLYTIYSIIKTKGIPESISATSYTVNSDLFTAFCILTGFTLLPTWLQASSDNLAFLPFISCAGITFAGVTPLFREGIQKPIHYISGIISTLSYLLWMVLSGNLYYLLCSIAVIMFLSFIDRKSYIFYTETVSLITLILYLI